MSSDWMDDYLGEDAVSGEGQVSEIYCPYTNNSECAMLVNGWQPQELCNALECEQLKLFGLGSQERHEAA